jgi:hypothetical protein
MAEFFPEIMTIEEASPFLHLLHSSHFRLARLAKPLPKVCRHWRFRRQAIDRWLDENLSQNMEKEKHNKPRQWLL